VAISLNSSVVYIHRMLRIPSDIKLYSCLVVVTVTILLISPLMVQNYLAYAAGIYPLSSHPFGLSYGEWTTKWWRWLLSIPSSHNPLTDKYGSDCSIHQQGPVWFLTQTAGGSVVRSCTIPPDKSILIPGVNAECSPAEDSSLKTESDIRACAKNIVDTASNIHVIVDGIEVKNITKYRTDSPQFTLTLPSDNVFGDTPGQTHVVSDGIWVMLQPLSPGKHTIRAMGTIIDVSTTSTSNFSTDATYNLTIK
jgi:hypothetical protein